MIRKLPIIRCLTVTAVLALALPAAGQAPQAQGGGGGRGGGRGGGGGTPTPPCGSAVTDPQNMAKDSRCFELRTYVVPESGPGDIALLHKRFREVTGRLFTKNGMTIVGFWHNLSKPSSMLYLLAFKDGAARDAAWAAFQADPEWAKAQTEMRVGLQTETVFMNATDYSPMK